MKQNDDMVGIGKEFILQFDWDLIEEGLAVLPQSDHTPLAGIMKTCCYVNYCM